MKESKRRMRLPSPAMLVAIVALVCSLSGVAYAALKANSVKSRTIKNGQVKPADLSANSKALWIYSDENGQRVNGSKGVTVERLTEGLYFVHFPKSVRKRALLGQIQNDPDNNITFSRCGGATGDNPSCSPEENDNPNTVFVQTADTENNNDSNFEQQDSSFWLTAVP